MNVHLQTPLEIWIVTGIPGAGKTTVARGLAQRFARATHIEGEALWRMIVSGREMPERDLAGESERQFELSVRNQCLLARSFAEAGFTPVLDFVVTTRYHLDAYRGYLRGATIRLSVLAPRPEVVARRDAARAGKTVGDRFMHLDATLREELAGVGDWVDSSDLDADQTVAAVLAGRVRATLT